MTIVRSLLVALLVIGATGACASDDASPTDDEPPAAPALDDTVWVLDAGDSSIVVEDGATVSMQLGDSTVSGTGGCNQYSGGVEIDGDSIRFESLARTEMACEVGMTTEEAFHGALAQVDTIDETDERLVLTGADGVRLSFTPLPATPELSEETLAGEWELTSLYSGSGPDGAVSSVMVGAGGPPTITFEAGGSVSVFDGCNQGTGEWQLEDGALAVTIDGYTKAGCDLDGQDGIVHAALDATAGAELSRSGLDASGAGGGLTLLDGDGNAVLGLTRS